MIKIHMLGKTRIDWGDRSLTGQMGSKTEALIYVLLMNYGKPVSRDKLCFYLWPDSVEEAAKYNLRYHLWIVKKVLDGEPFIVSDKDCCSINTSLSFQCDFLQLQRYSPNESDTIESLLSLKELFCGDFMEGWYLKNCNEFNEMILFERMACEKKQMQILSALANRYARAGRMQEELEAWQEAALIEPDNEDIALRIMNGYAGMGNRTAAINYYKSFEAALWNNIGIAPKEDLNCLYSELLEQGSCAAEDVNHMLIERGGDQEQILSVMCCGTAAVSIISSIAERLLCTLDLEALQNLGTGYWSDLSYVQREALPLAERSEPPVYVPEVRVVNAFWHLLLIIQIKHIMLFLPKSGAREGVARLMPLFRSADIQVECEEY